MIMHDSSNMRGFGGSSKPLGGRPAWIVVRATMTNLEKDLTCLVRTDKCGAGALIYDLHFQYHRCVEPSP